MATVRSAPLTFARLAVPITESEPAPRAVAEPSASVPSARIVPA